MEDVDMALVDSEAPAGVHMALAEVAGRAAPNRRGECMPEWACSAGAADG